MSGPAPSPASDRGARCAAALWLAAVAGAAAGGLALSGLWRAFYASLGLELPWVTHATVELTAWLAQPVGIVALAVAGALPLVALKQLEPREARRHFTLGAVQVLLAGGASVAALGLPLTELGSCVCGQHAVEGPAWLPWWTPAVRPGLIATGLLFLVAGALQLSWWATTCGRLWATPRSDALGRELTLVALVAAVPALVAAAVAGPAGAALGAPAAGVLVSPALAAAASAAAVVFLGVLGLRLRKEAPE